MQQGETKLTEVYTKSLRIPGDSESWTVLLALLYNSTRSFNVFGFLVNKIFMNIDVQVYFLRQCFKALKMRVCDIGISSAFKSNTQRASE